MQRLYQPPPPQPIKPDKNKILNKKMDAAIYEYIQELEFRKKLDDIMNSGESSGNKKNYSN